MSVYLDTHIAVWLHAGLVERLSRTAKDLIEQNDLLLSPMVLLELQYLADRKRIAFGPQEIHSYLNATFGIELCPLPFAAVVREAIRLLWTADPFDRLIVAQAIANHRSPLITADTVIRRNYDTAAW